MNYVDRLIALLATVDAELVREVFEERAAVREYDGGFSREDAETLAFADTLNSF